MNKKTALQMTFLFEKKNGMPWANPKRKKSQAPVEIAQLT